jgi:hypothetical protein
MRKRAPDASGIAGSVIPRAILDVVKKRNKIFVQKI